MLSKVYCFLARALILLADHRILLDFPQILLTTTAFSFSLSSLVSFASLFSLVSFAFCFSVFFFLFFIFVFCLFETKDIYSDTHWTMRAGMR